MTVLSKLRRIQERVPTLKGKKREDARAPNESGAIICLNPKCRSKIEEPILLNNLSTTPAEQYHACPRCFIKMGGEAHPLLENVLDVMHASVRRRRNKALKTNHLLRTQSLKKKEEPPIKPSEKEEKRPSRCLHSRGYLASRPKNVPIPEECLICLKILECMRR